MICTQVIIDIIEWKLLCWHRNFLSRFRHIVIVWLCICCYFSWFCKCLWCRIWTLFLVLHCFRLHWILRLPQINLAFWRRNDEFQFHYFQVLPPNYFIFKQFWLCHLMCQRNILPFNSYLVLFWGLTVYDCIIPRKMMEHFIYDVLNVKTIFNCLSFSCIVQCFGICHASFSALSVILYQ